MSEHSRQQRMIGIIGGMGPAATSRLFQNIIELTPAKRDQDHLHILINNDPGIPDRTLAITGRGPSPLRGLVQSARVLQSAGATLLAMPCATAHAYIQDIRQSVSAQILSLVEQTALHLERYHSGIASVGLLATDGSLHADIFGPLRSSWQLLTPLAEEQRQLMAAIYGGSGVKTIGPNPVAMAVVSKVVAALVSRGAQVIVAGCTEIPLVLPGGSEPLVLDVLKVLAAAVVSEAYKPQPGATSI